MAGKKLFSLSKFLRRDKHARQEVSDGGDANHHRDPVALPENTVTEPLENSDSTQIPQTGLQAQHAHSTPTAGAMTLSTHDPAGQDSIPKQSATPAEPKLLWDRAYDSLREDQLELVEAYEKVLSCELSETPTASSVSDAQQNRIEQKNTEMRRSQMKQLVDKGLAKTEHEAKIKQGTGDVLTVVLNLNAMISTALTKCPEAALAWSGVTLALQMITNPIKETEENRKSIHYVIIRMGWYWDLSSRLFKERGPNDESYAGLRSGLEEQLIHLYRELLSYQMKSVCSYYRNRGLVFLKDLVQLHGWDGQMNDIDKIATICDESINQYTMQQHLDFNQQQLQSLGDINNNLQDLPSQQRNLQQEEKNSNCLRDLRLTDPNHDMERIEDTKGRLVSESSTWILYHPYFTDWRRTVTTRLLWVRGDPGKGKTMLLISIIKELLKSPPESSFLSFFFCQETDANLNNATAVLRGLIYRLVCQQPFLIQHLREEYDRSGSKLFEGSNALVAMSSILAKMLRDPGLNQVYLVVDALDECQPGLENLLKFIVKSLSDPSSRVKWIVSSRHKPEIEKRLSYEKSKADLNLEKDADDQVSHAVKAYIDHKMQSLIAQYEKIYDNIQYHDILVELRKVEDDVAEELRKKAENTFLWVALVFEQIEVNDCDADEVLEFVRKMPAGLHEMYNKMMRPIIQQNAYSEDCKTVLLIAVNSYRPLRLSEMVTLAALSLLARPRKIIQLCGLLSLREEDQVIYFVHQSAKDYLIQNADPEIQTGIFPNGQAEGHHKILSRSLESMSKLKRDIYDLKHPGFPIARVPSLSPDPLEPIRYACVYWVDHLGEMETSQNRLYLSDNSDVDAFLKRRFLYWLEALSLIKSMSNGVSATAKLVSLVTSVSCDSKLSKLAQDAHRFILLNRGVIENTPLQVYYSALIFSPAGSLTRSHFKDEEPYWITTKPAMEPEWDTCLQTLESHSRQVCSVALSSDGTHIASGSGDDTIKIWDTSNGACLQTLKGHIDQIASVALSLEGTHIFSGSYDNTIKIWDAGSGACLKTLRGHNGPVTSVALFPNGTRIASGSSDSTIKIWDASSGAYLKTLDGHSDLVSSVALFSDADGTYIASGSWDSTIKIWNASSGACLKTLEGHMNMITAIALSPDGACIVSGSWNGTIKIWDSSSEACLQTLEGDRTHQITSVALFPDRTHIASASGDNTVRIWNSASGVCIQTLEGHNSSVTSMALSADGTYIASGSSDNTIKIWDASSASGACLQTLESHSNWITSVALSPDSAYIASGSWDNTVKIWDASSGAYLKTLDGHSDLVSSVALFSDADGTYIASGSWDSTVKIWNAGNEACLRTLEDHSDCIISVALFSDADGTYIASGSDDKTIKIWNARSGDCLQTLKGHNYSANSVALSPNGIHIASRSSDNIIEIWNASSGACLQTLKGHDKWITSMALSPDGTYIAASSKDNTIKIWDAGSGVCLQTLEGQGQSVKFDAATSRFRTEMGIVPWNGATNTQKVKDTHICGTPQHHTYRLSIDWTWITWNGQNMLWLPLEYRPTPSEYRPPDSSCTAITSNTMVIGCRSGRVLVFNFSDKAPL